MNTVRLSAVGPGVGSERPRKPQSAWKGGVKVPHLRTGTQTRYHESIPHLPKLWRTPVLEFHFVSEHQLPVVLLQATMKFLQAACFLDRTKERGAHMPPFHRVCKHFASPRFSCQLAPRVLSDSASLIYRIDFELSKEHFPASL